LKKWNRIPKVNTLRAAVFAAALIFLGGLVLESQAQMVPFAFWKVRNLWTWMGGNTSQTLSGVYGTLGASTANFPGARQKTTTGSDASGNFWVFGGYSHDGNSALTATNDLWQYTPADGKWNWMSGSSTGSPSGVYGTKGTGSTSNFPGARTEPVSWIDGSGNFWVFGGGGPDVNGDWDLMNDLWRYTPADGKWAWMAGGKISAVHGTYGTVNVAAASNAPGGRSAAATAVDAAGNLWLYGGYGFGASGVASNLNDLWKFDPTTGYWTWMSGGTSTLTTGTYGTPGTLSLTNVPGGRINHSLWADAAGNLWTFGGFVVDAASNLNDSNELWKFQISTRKWAWMGGTNTGTAAGAYGTKGVGSTANIPGSRDSSMYWKDGSGNFWLFGGSGVDSVAGHNGSMNDLWKFNPTSLQWTWVSGPNLYLASGTYGTKGTGSTSNAPGARYDNHRGFVDASGDFWIFGGYILDANGRSTSGNDLWKYGVSGGAWTWMSGSSANLQLPTYGTKGTASTGNLPGARVEGNAWVDGSGNFWLLGGIGIDASDNSGILNDLWKYVPGTKTWTWVSGTTQTYQTGTYGTKGTAAVANTPGARTAGANWTDASGNLWLFGGYSYDSAGNDGDMNDVWKLDVTTGRWAWMAGSNVRNSTGTFGTPGTGATTNIPSARESPTNAVDSAGVVWIFGGYGTDSAGAGGYLNDFWRYTPADGKWTWMTGSNLANAKGTYGSKGTGNTGNTPGARVTATSWIDSNGAFWLFGGYGKDASAGEGNLNDLWRYTPADGKWTWMNGSSAANASGTYGTKGVAAAANTPPNRQGAAGWVDASGNFWLLGGEGPDNHGNYDYIGELWSYSPTANQWTWVGGDDTILQYGSYGSLGVASPANIPGARSTMRPWIDSKKAVWFFGGGGAMSPGGGKGYTNDLWRFGPP
jgi:N-acetylneuraminic acid mutarotase